MITEPSRVETKNGTDLGRVGLNTILGSTQHENFGGDLLCGDEELKVDKCCV
jgi:hypothetical protein